MMSIAEKMIKAKNTNWIADGFSDVEVKSIVELARISACIEKCRIDMKMTQKEFADYMGVTQGMVSKWESRDYNFTIKTLNDICEKIDLELTVTIDRPKIKDDYYIYRWNSEVLSSNCNIKKWGKIHYSEETVA